MAYCMGSCATGSTSEYSGTFLLIPPACSPPPPAPGSSAPACCCRVGAEKDSPCPLPPFAAGTAGGAASTTTGLCGAGACSADGDTARGGWADGAGSDESEAGGWGLGEASFIVFATLGGASTASWASAAACGSAGGDGRAAPRLGDGKSFRPAGNASIAGGTSPPTPTSSTVRLTPRALHCRNTGSDACGCRV